MTETVNSPDLIDGVYREGAPITDTKAPAGDISGKWTTRKFEAALVNPANRRKLSVIIVGTGLAGASAGATLYIVYRGFSPGTATSTGPSVAGATDLRAEGRAEARTSLRWRCRTSVASRSTEIAWISL